MLFLRMLKKLNQIFQKNHKHPVKEDQAEFNWKVKAKVKVINHQNLIDNKKVNYPLFTNFKERIVYPNLQNSLKGRLKLQNNEKFESAKTMIKSQRSLLSKKILSFQAKKMTTISQIQNNSNYTNTTNRKTREILLKRIT